MPRGGKRDGAGRRTGVPTTKTLQRRAIAEKAVAKGITPLEVMLANMRHFQKLAESAEAALAEMTPDKIAGLKPDDQFKFLLAEVKKTAGLREMAHSCARDAANYLHPRLTAISAPDGGPIKIERIERVIVSAVS